MKKNKTKETIALTVILLISFAVWLVVPYAQHLAHGREIEWNYYIVKGIIIGLASVAVYLFADKYGATLFEKYSKPILYIGTTILLVFAIFKYPLYRIETPVFSKTVSYAYSALPFLEIITLCALNFCLDEILTGNFTFSKFTLIVAAFVMTCLLNDVFKVMLLIILSVLLIKQLKRKNIISKAAIIIVTVLNICLSIYLIYVFSKGLKTLLTEWNNTSFMAYISRNVWSQAKLFGTMENLKLVGGSIFNFSLLWLISFLGIIPALIIVISLIFLVLQMIKQGENRGLANPIKNLALIYFCVRIFLAILANCGIVLVGLMTPVPMIMDTVSGMLCSFSLLGLCNTGDNRVNATSN